MITNEAYERVRGWFSGRLPQDWQAEPAGISIDRDEIVVMLHLPDVEAGETDTETAEARAGRASAFREDTREQRMAIAREAQRRYERTVSWGVAIGEHRELFTHLAAPTMTRLRQPQRQVLDTLVDAGGARSRSESLAWCVRPVGQHEGDWLAELRDAMTHVADVRTKGPAACAGIGRGGRRFREGDLPRPLRLQPRSRTPQPDHRRGPRHHPCAGKSPRRPRLPA